MKSIKENNNSTYIINKSKFICFLYKVNSINEINNYLDNIKKEYKDSTHICYAYILDNIKKMSDDKEPSGTAGMPILNVLESNELNHILCIVVRYFGGIKLGAGGLVRAYTKSVTNCLEKCNIKELKNMFKITISFTYDETKKVDNILKEYEIIDKEYDDLIYYTFISDNDNFNLNIIKKENILY